VKARNFDKAVEHFRKAVEAFPCNYSYHVALGKALTDKGELLAAIREYEAIPASHQGSAILEGNKKAVYRLLVSDYQKKAMANPADAGVHFALGVFHFKLGDGARALQEYRRAVSLKPDYYDALLNVAATSEMLGDAASARDAYVRLAAADDPKNLFRAQAQASLSRLDAVSKNSLRP